MLFKFLFTLYYLTALGLGGFLGYREWGGIAGGLFMGLLLGTTLFYALGITLAHLPRRDADDGADPQRRS